MNLDIDAIVIHSNKAMLKTFSLKLPVIKPFRLDLTVWILRRRERNIVDQWNKNLYSRTLIIQGSLARVDITQTKEDEIEIIVTSTKNSFSFKDEISSVITHMLGLDTDLKEFYKFGKNTPLYPIIQNFKGFKPPRFPTIFETLCNGVVCQQISLEAALSILNRFVIAYGKSMGGLSYSFPDIEDVAQLNDLSSVGLSHNKSSTILHIAQSSFDLEVLKESADEEIMMQLGQFKGIGRWTIEYTLLRGYGRLSILPGDDVGLQKNIQHVLELPERASYDQIKAIEKEWFPYGGLIYFNLLLNNLSEKRN